MTSEAHAEELGHDHGEEDDHEEPISARVKPMMSVSNSGATLSIGWKSQPAGTQALVES